MGGFLHFHRPEGDPQFKSGPAHFLQLLILGPKSFLAGMNKNLLVFALFLIILGVASGIYLLSLFGIILMVPAALPSSRRTQTPPQPTRPSQPQPWSAPRRVPSEARRPPMAPTPQPQTMATRTQPSQPSPTQMQPYSQVQPSSQMLPYSPALFPGSIFPPVYAPGTQVSPPASTEAKKSPERDDLVEAGAVLLLLKLFLG